MGTTIYNPQAFIENLTSVFRSASFLKVIRGCLITTRDREQAIKMIVEASSQCQMPLYHTSVSTFRRYVSNKLSWEEVARGEHDPTAMFEQVLKTEGGGVFIFEDCIQQLRDEGGDRQARMKFSDMLSSADSKSGIILVFVEPPETGGRLPAMLAEQIVKLEVPYPRFDELQTMAREEIAAIAHQANVPISMDLIRNQAVKLADGLVGTTRKAARDVLRDGLIAYPGKYDAAADYLTRQKVQRLSRDLAMNVLETEAVETPIGLDNLLHFLEVHKDKLRLPGRNRARGVLLVGPPGTGKTMLAKAVGKLVELPVVEFRISSLMNSLLGETERRFAQAFATLEAMAPNVVFIDEIEKAFGDSSERDGGTMMRCTGALLSWLSDNPYPNFIVATCNSLKRMGEIGLTMTRSERFDSAFFVDVPEYQARMRMFKRWLEGKMTASDGMCEILAKDTEKFSGADLFSLIKQASARAEHSGQGLSLDILKAEIDRKHARVLALYEEFSVLRHWGNIFCEPAGLSDEYK
jgi:predicted kinase